MNKSWSAIRDALRRQHPSLTEAGLRKAQAFNFQRYHFQGIGRYAPDAAYARGLADLKVLADIIPANGYVHGETQTSIDAGIYGSIANIFFYDIDTPLKQFVVSAGNMVRPQPAGASHVVHLLLVTDLISFLGRLPSGSSIARRILATWSPVRSIGSVNEKVISRAVLELYSELAVSVCCHSHLPIGRQALERKPT